MPQQLTRQRVGGIPTPQRATIPTGLFGQQQKPQGNLFDTVNNVIQMRRKSQREAIEDQLLQSKAKAEIAKSEADVEEIKFKMQKSGTVKNFLSPDISNDDVISAVSEGALDPTEAKKILEIKSFQTPQEKSDMKLKEQSDKPLSGESAIKESGAKQGLRNVTEIEGLLSGLSDAERIKLLKELASSRLEGVVESKTPTGVLSSIGQSAERSLVRKFVSPKISDNARKLENAFSLLAENILRARTGAAAPEPEVVRELSRNLVRVFESKGSAEGRLAESKQLLEDTLKSIRPLRSDVDASGEDEQVALPEGVTEEDIQTTMEENDMTREQVLVAIGVL